MTLLLRRLALVMVLALPLIGCEEKKMPRPPPVSLTSEAMGRYCGMNLLEHAGPKGQVLLKNGLDPVWFSSARDTIAFTMLPDEPRDIVAVYVSDMAMSENWDNPGATNWVEARDAFFVIDSRKRGGMGAPEAVPFSDKAAAERFISANGGQLVGFNDIPQSYILGSGDVPELLESGKGAGAHGNH